MKTSKTILQAAVILLSLGFLPQSSRGQIYLTGLEQNGTAPNGQNAGSPIFNTLGNEASFANIYVTQPNGGYNAPFINSGNGSSASISYALTTGTYQFYIFTMSFWNNNPGYYALNFFFGGDNTNPGISAYSPANTSTAAAIAAGLATLSLDGDNSNPVPSPGSVAYIANNLTVTLTGYGYGEPGVFGGPAIDRVGNLSSQPDGYADAVGVFTLTVVPVPEPSVSGLLVVGLFGLTLLSRRRSYSFGVVCAIAVVLQFGVLASSAQTGIYLFSGSETTITLNPGTYDITAYGAQGGSGCSSRSNRRPRCRNGRPV